ncbi:hypothetical protein EVJ58_g8866 [Rhodofomes roseus]|uniref:F-box domain-containing protein n=1 Tax=Rhodofomes roseus TaxID=34475 RepID=A0A4Y9XWD4_9APHY|nr:hypothetical protein EVJ58_g8866 [Rhodofomes roseus]
MIPSLPLELNDYIVDYLHNDTRFLGSCALTCRTWLVAARYHRFREPIVETDEDLMAFGKLVALSPTLGPVVRRLRISRFTSAVLCSALPALPALTTLELDDCDFESGDFTSVDAKLPALQELTMELCTIGLDTLAQLLSALSGLKRLSIAQPYAILPGVPVLGRLDSLRSLRLDFCDLMLGEDAKVLVDWLLSTLQPQQLLTLHVIRLYDPRPMQPLFDTFGPGGLEHATIELYYLEGIATTGFRLERCVNLRSLSIELGNHTEWEGNTMDLRWSSLLISQLNSPSLETITLTVITRPFEPQDDWEFNDIQALDWQSINCTHQRRRAEMRISEGSSD